MHINSTFAFYFMLEFWRGVASLPIRQPRRGRGRAYARKLKEWRPSRDLYSIDWDCMDFKGYAFDHAPAQELYDELVNLLDVGWGIIPTELERELIDELDELLDLVA